MLVRKSSYDREVERLETELALTRREFDLQRASLVSHIRDALAEDITGRVRGETREERQALTRHRDRFFRLIKVAQSFLPESRSDPTLPIYTEDEARAIIREILREVEQDQSPHLHGVYKGSFVR